MESGDEMRFTLLGAQTGTFKETCTTLTSGSFTFYFSWSMGNELYVLHVFIKQL